MRKKSLVFSLCLTVILSTMLFVANVFAQGDAQYTSPKSSLPFVQGEILVKPKTGKNLDTINSLVGGTTLEVNKRLGVQKVKLPPGASLSNALNLYMNNPNVEYAEPNFIAQASFTPNDPDYAKQWALAKISEPQAWDISRGSSATVVAVIDTGVDYTHPDLSGKLVSPYNVLTKSAALSSVADTVGHGTHVAGIIGATVDNKIGVAGVGGNVSIMPLKVSNDGTFLYSDLVTAIYYATDHGARVINMSLGGYSYSSTLKDAVDYAYAHNVVVVAAAGNDGISDPIFPAAFGSVISVAATNPSDAKASFSNWGDWVEISAPGVSIYSTTPTAGSQLYGAGYDYSDGTSMATPAVSGLAGLVVSLKPSLSNYQVRGLIDTNADDINTPGYDSYTGNGRINSYKTLQAALAPAPTVSVSPAGGTYSNPVSVTLTASQSYCDIYYTTDGSDPQIYGAYYSGPITINTSATLKYYAEGLSGSSPVYSQTYNIVPLTVSASVAGGTYGTPQTVTLTASEQSTTIYYTTDGSMPSSSSAVYSGPIAINTGKTLKYFAAGPTGSSQVYTQVYVISPTVSISPRGGTFEKPLQVTLSMQGQGGKIFYTSNGTDPTASSPVYSQPINIQNQTVLKYLGMDQYGNYSQIYTETFSIRPVVNASLPGGTYNAAQSITLSTAVPASIYYTTDGSTPTTGSTVYVNPISVSNTATLKYIAVDAFGNQSQIYSQTYTIDTVAPTVTANFPGGFYATKLSVALTASEPATIYFTTNGSEPTLGSAVYSGPINLDRNTTLKYIARDQVGNLSTVFSQSYTIEGLIPGSLRLAGSDRISTAVAISRQAFAYPNTADAVLLATGQNFPDALAGASLGKIKNAPLLLVESFEQSQLTLNEIARVLKPGGTVYVLGGDGVVPPIFSTYLQGQGYVVKRLAGADRYGTAAAICREVKVTGGGEIIVATGEDFPDSLSISPYAVANGLPIVLVNQDGISPAFVDYLRTLQPTAVTIVGGTGVVPAAVESQLKALLPGANFRRFGGLNRFDTCAKISAGIFGTGRPSLFVATGTNFPDALSGAVLAGFNNAPILLVNPTEIPAEIANYLTQLHGKNAVAFGGTGVVSETIYQQVLNYVR